MSEPNPEDTPMPAATGSKMPVWAFPIITGVAGLILGGLIVGVGGFVASGLADVGEAASRSTVFAGVLKDCDLKNDANSEIADGGYTLVVESRGKEDLTGLEYSDLTCILDRINTPQAVMSHFGQTTSMDGRQTESWDDFTLSWSYHPDRGADFIVTIDHAE